MEQSTIEKIKSIDFKTWVLIYIFLGMMGFGMGYLVAVLF